MRIRNIIVLLSLLIPFCGSRAECAGWSVAIAELPPTLCVAQTINLNMSVQHESDELSSADYRWYVKKPSSSDFDQVAIAVATTYTFDEVGIYTLYAEARPNDCEDYQQSSIVTIELLPLFSAGSIAGNQTICYNTIPGALTETAAPTGGNHGRFVRQWQKSKDGSSWSDINGETGFSFQPTSAITETTIFRILYTDSCATIASNEATVMVRTPATAPEISSSTARLCYDETTAILTCTTEATGATDETFEYQWQVSADGVEFYNIEAATGLTYTTPKQTSAQWYRIVATSSQGCGSVASASVKVDVYQDWSITNITTNPLCYMSAGEISVSATGDEDSYLYQWQEFDGTDWQNILSANAASYNIPGRIAGQYKYRALVVPTNGCAPKFSDIFVVDVYDDLTANTISGIDTVCYNNSPSALSQIVAPTGADGSFTYQWQVKTTGSWSDIAGANSTTYQPAALTSTTYYRLKATSPYCDKFVLSNEIEVYVRKDLMSPVIFDSPETVCYGFAPDLITIPTLATCDIHDSLTYQWQVKTVGDWQNIPGATKLTYQPEAITIPHQYRVIATSVKGCGSRESNVRTVNVYDDLQITTSGVAPLCYMTRGTISVSATGEGGTYEYQWQDSTNGIWSDVTGGNAQQYLTQPKQHGDYFYRCIVKPTLGCTPDTSDIIKVTVYDSIAPGTITPIGADTICYGFTPDAISVDVDASGGDGSFTYQWMRRQDGVANFSYIPGATSTTYAPSILYKSTEYQLEVTNKCDVKYTNIVRIYVRDELQAPVLAEHNDTICYNTIPEPIVTSSLGKAGVDDSLTYQWEQSLDDKVYTAIPGATNIIYQPNALLATHYYRLRATSVKECGNVVSNTIKVNVYDSLRITAISPDTLCHMTSTTISVSAVGDGDSFEYQWQDSANGVWNDISGAVGAACETLPKGMGSYYYRCIVTSKKCEDYYHISPLITVSVYDTLSPGSIIGTDSTCYGYAPAEPLRVDVAATGVDGRYTYQWQKSENDVWTNIIGATATSYQPDPLFKGSNYRLQVATKCDTLYTNSIFIRVNPLPDVQVISGSDYVCYNQHELYSVEHLNPGYTYQWLIERGEGDLTTEAVNTTSIDVLWKTPNSTDSVILRVTNDATGCERDLKFGVSICNEQAPEYTIIVRKPNSNILVCQEDAQLVYQWGYTEKSSLQEFPIEDSNRRYVLLPHAFDAVSYDYWLTLRHTETSPCYSRSYYSADNDTLITPPAANVSVPSYVRKHIPIVVQNPDEAQITCALYTLSGELIGRCDLGNAQNLSTTLPISVHSGMYVMHVSMGDYVKSIKLIAE